MNGLKDDRIKYLVKSRRGDDATLLQLIETASNEESELKSQRFRSNQNWLTGSTPGHTRGQGQVHQPKIKQEIMTVTDVENVSFVIRQGT